MKLFNGGHVLYITGGFPPASGGSCVLNQNLLKGFDNNSYTVVTYKPYVNRVKLIEGIEVFYPIRHFKRLNTILTPLQTLFLGSKMRRLVRSKKPKLIMAAYPDMFFLEVAYKLSMKYDIPLVIYLHDTIYEAHKGTKMESYALDIQNRVFKRADLIFVMSSGMEELYERKYNLKTIPLRHTFDLNNQPMPTSKHRVEDTLFWGGAIYSINRTSLSKLSQVLAKQDDITLELASPTTEEMLTRSGFSIKQVKVTFYKDPENYLSALMQSKCLLLMLDKQSDTKVDFDEIATIFPTKAIEYMFTKVPILVICPRDYFLYRFFEENRCGIVIDDIDDHGAIIDALSRIENFDSHIQEMVNRAEQVGKELFNARAVRARFNERLNQFYAQVIST